MAIELEVIRNPRTADGGFEDDKNGCHICGCITTAYISITLISEKQPKSLFEFSQSGGDTVSVKEKQSKICKGCLNDMEYMLDRAILNASINVSRAEP